MTTKTLLNFIETAGKSKRILRFKSTNEKTLERLESDSDHSHRVILMIPLLANQYRININLEKTM